MFSTLSMTGTGIIVFALSLALQKFGITVGNDDLTALVTNGSEFISSVLIVWGQVRRPDLTLGMVRKGTPTN